MHENNKVVCRACFLSERPERGKLPEAGIITIGGFRANELRHYDKYSFFGILVGKPASAVRNTGIPFVKNSTLSDWATEQGNLRSSDSNEDRYHTNQLAAVICKFGGNPGGKKIGTCQKGDLSIKSIKNWKVFPDEVLLVDDDNDLPEEMQKIKLKNNVLVFPMFRFNRRLFETDEYNNRVAWPDFPAVKLTSKLEIRVNSIYYQILITIAEKWNVMVADIVEVSDFSEKEYTIGKKGTRSVKRKASLIKNPSKK